jgi:hypothetical protein
MKTCLSMTLMTRSVQDFVSALRRQGVAVRAENTPGHFPRRRAEQARSRWFDALLRHARAQELEAAFQELARWDAGAAAEETAGRYLNLLKAWRQDCIVLHGAEVRAPGGTTQGDLDHLVVFTSLDVAFAVETKIEITAGNVASHAAAVIAQAERLEALTDLMVWPVLCSLRGDWQRGFTDCGVLIAAADWLPAALTWPVVEIDAFRAGPWRFPEHRSAP